MLSELKEVSCLVLLGDVGMGKSTTVREEADRLAREVKDQDHFVIYQDLKRLTEEQIYRRVFGHPNFESWMRGENTLTLFLDSMDECWRRIEELESILVGELKQCLSEKRPPLFLRITCRSAEWRGSVGEAFKSLENRFPGDPYENDDGGGSVTAVHEMYHFRLGVLQSLIQRGTREACLVMANLITKRPADFWLGNLLAEMRQSARRLTWKRSEPKSLMGIFTDAEKRLIKTAGDLQLILIESIRKYEAALHEVQPTLELWNCVREGSEKVWDPKDENNVSDCLKRHFERDLDRRGIFASREVQIRQRFGDDRAQHVDLAVTAFPLSEDGKPDEPVTVIVEVKCAWNLGRVFKIGF